MFLRRHAALAQFAGELGHPSQNHTAYPRHEVLEDRRNHLRPLREMIFRAFPASIYYGIVIAGGDDGPWVPAAPGETSDDEDLFRMLKQARWTGIPAGFLATHLGAFVLLTAEAFAAFIPAWLAFSLDNNFQGAEFVAYTFAPRDPASPQQSATRIRPLSIELFCALTPPQRRTLHIFLETMADYSPTYTLRQQALAAADAVDSLVSVFEKSAHP